ncbi:hypothetical protein SEPCBS57363_002262 [Sporothrix epigloea]|uniref:Uncharacterized protein n=1 Tax=Sporothrix epigloea TaxID=1892477 RepID=A0ABP0DIW5_9PEZI
MPTADEIKSVRGEYLPTTDTSLWHTTGLHGRLDREFRLLREDTVGQLRDVVRFEIDRLQQKANGNEGKSARLLNQDSIQYCVYEDATMLHIDFDTKTGPDFLVRVNQPANGNESSKHVTSTNEEATKSLEKRRNWWTAQSKKRLPAGGLVCSIDSLGSVCFFTVGNSTVRSKSIMKAKYRDEENKSSSQQPELTLADDPNYAYVRLTLFGIANENQLSSALNWFLQSKTGGTRLLLEFPGILVATFLNTLQVLQNNASLLTMPFAEIIAPEVGDSQSQGQYEYSGGIPPPRYVQNPGFVFDLSCLATDGEILTHSLEAPASPEDIEKRTQLDSTQATTLLEALLRSMALIQGPPGTGKTFVGVQILKVLLKNQKAANLGPIVIVCYTNHALDQLLEHVLDTSPGVNIIRMGAMSKSERLINLSLREASQQVIQTRSEKHSLWMTGTTMKKHCVDLEEKLRKLGESTNPSGVKAFLQNHIPSAYSELFGDEEEGDEGFITVRGNDNKTLHRWLSGGELHPSIPAYTAARGLWALPKQARYALYQEWQCQSFKSNSSEMETEYKLYEAVKKARDRTRHEVDLRCLNEANIVGMTTIGLAKNYELLQNLGSKVLLCEEAGEVLEAHMLVSLIHSVEHAILIGDHLQLRPQIQNYDLSSESTRGKQFSFDMSLFERLVAPPLEGEAAIPFSQLSTQRRMHPSISALIRAPLYPALQDGSNVRNYPEVSGMAQRLFWFQHQCLEDGVASKWNGGKDINAMSRTNSFEVEMTVALVSHLFKQGTYTAGDIAVLTPYLGQLMLLRKRLSTMFELTFNERDQADLEAVDKLDELRSDSHGTDSADKADVRDGKLTVSGKTTLLNSVRAATVDNFQGEEAKVVVISLVRSNEQRRCGFLRTSNRINVLLSRARHGMYILGNSDTYSGIPMWQSVMTALNADNNMGPSFPLQCPRHPERAFEASLPDHFVQFAPDGGCPRPYALRRATGSHVRSDAQCALIVATNVCFLQQTYLLFVVLARRLSRFNFTDRRTGPTVCGEQCPDVRFCQQCGDEAVLDQTVDLFVMSTYREIDLNEDPCIFPRCGHVLTMTSMDGLMGVTKGSVPGASTSPFDMEEAKACPSCRGSLRNIARYGRIVRRALLDESTKRFISWAHQRHGELALQLMEQKDILESGTNAAVNSRHENDKRKIVGGAGRSALVKILLLSTHGSHFSSLIKTRAAIAEYSAKVATDEQPYQRVADLVKFALKQRKDGVLTPDQFVFDASMIQIGSSLQAELLLMRCDILALELVAARLEMAALQSNVLTPPHRHSKREATFFATDDTETLMELLRSNRFANMLEEYEASVEVARAAKRTRQEADSRLCCVNLCLVLWKLHNIKGGTAVEDKAEGEATFLTLK